MLYIINGEIPISGNHSHTILYCVGPLATQYLFHTAEIVEPGPSGSVKGATRLLDRGSTETPLSVLHHLPAPKSTNQRLSVLLGSNDLGSV